MSRYLGLDLGGTNIKTVVLEDDGAGGQNVIASATVPTHADLGPDGVAGRLGEIGARHLAEHGPLGGIGLGVPGLFDRERGTIELFPNLAGPWPGFPLRGELETSLGQPVTLINDARAFSLAEATLGAGRGRDTVVGMTLGTGIGGGIVIGGRLQLGRWGTASEIGHQILVADGPECGCGNRGCLEALARSGVLVDLAGKSDASEVFVTAAAGDERSRRAIETVTGWIGIGLANVVTTLGPDRIVIGGGLISAGDQLLDPIRGAVRRRVTLAPADEVEIVAAELGPIAGAVGAALAGRPAA